MRAAPILLALSAPFLWFGYFAAAYLAISVACAGIWPVAAAYLVSGVLTVLTGLIVLWLMWASWRQRHGANGFVARFGLILGGLSLVATVWVGLSLLTTSCR